MSGVQEREIERLEADLRAAQLEVVRLRAMNERTLDYVDVLEDCFGFSLALLAASSEEQATAARDGLNAAMARGPSTQIAAAEAGVQFRTPAMRAAPPPVMPESETKH